MNKEWLGYMATTLRILIIPRVSELISKLFMSHLKSERLMEYLSWRTQMKLKLI